MLMLRVLSAIFWEESGTHVSIQVITTLTVLVEGNVLWKHINLDITHFKNSGKTSQRLKNKTVFRKSGGCADKGQRGRER